MSDGVPPAERTAFWQAHVTAWRGCDLNRRQYCDQNDLPYHRFCVWVRRLQPRHAIVTARPQARQTPLRLVAPAGWTLELEALPSPDWLAELIRRLAP